MSPKNSNFIINEDVKKHNFEQKYQKFNIFTQNADNSLLFKNSATKMSKMQDFNRKCRQFGIFAQNADNYGIATQKRKIKPRCQKFTILNTKMSKMHEYAPRCQKCKILIANVETSEFSARMTTTMS